MPDASGSIQTGAVTLSTSGWWEAAVALTPAGADEPYSTRTFWLILPDPTATGSGPQSVTDPAAQALFEEGMAALTALRAVHVATSFNDGRGAYSFWETDLRSATDDQAAASVTWTHEADGTRTGEMIVGGQRWITVAAGGWVEAEPIPFTTPPDWEHDYAGTTGFQLAPVQPVAPDGERYQIVTFWQPVEASPSGEPAWYAWWFGPNTGRVRREVMISSDIYRVRTFSRFDEPFRVDVPGTTATFAPTPLPVTSTPQPSPRAEGASGTPSATPPASTAAESSPVVTPEASACAAAYQDDSATSTRTLIADCITDVPIVVPGGWTFDGNGHTIRVVDPPGSMFQGGVIERRQGMGVGGVTNVTIDGSGLTPGCSPDSEVVGILFAEEGGTISEVTIVDLRRGTGEPCGVGIAIIGAAFYDVDIHGTTITNAGSIGIVAVAGAVVEATGNQISGGLNGVVFYGASTRGRIAENRIADTAQQGITVVNYAAATLASNVVTNAGEAGIHASQGAIVDVTDGNQLRRNAFGIVVEGVSTRATIEETVVEETANIAILVSAAPKIQVSGTELVSGGPTVQVSGNTVRQAVGAGIVAEGAGTRGTIADNTIEEMEQDGIVVQDAARVTVSGNTVATAGRFGVGVLSGATAEVSDNTMTEVDVIGILAASGATAEVIDNRVTGPRLAASAESGPFGVAFSEGATGSIADNTVTGHGNQDPMGQGCGIRIDADAGEVEVRDNQFPPPGNAVDLCDERQ